MNSLQSSYGDFIPANAGRQSSPVSDQSAQRALLTQLQRQAPAKGLPSSSLAEGSASARRSGGGRKLGLAAASPSLCPALTHTYRTQEGQREGSAPGRCPRRFEIESAENKHPSAPPQGFSPPVPAQGAPLSRTQHRRLLKQRQMASQRINKPTSCPGVQYKKQQGDCQVFTR